MSKEVTTRSTSSHCRGNGQLYCVFWYNKNKVLGIEMLYKTQKSHLTPQFFLYIKEHYSTRKFVLYSLTIWCITQYLYYSFLLEKMLPWTESIFISNKLTHGFSVLIYIISICHVFYRQKIHRKPSHVSPDFYLNGTASLIQGKEYIVYPPCNNSI